MSREHFTQQPFSFSASSEINNLLSLAQVCLNHSDFQRAIQIYSNVIRLEKQTEAAAFAYLNRGVAQANIGQFRLAIPDWQQAARISLQFAVQAYSLLARVHSEIGDVTSTVTDYDNLIRIQPQESSHYNNRGLMFMQLNDFHSATNDFTQAIRCDPKNYVAWFNRGRARQQLDNFDTAILDYTEATKLNANDPDIFYWRALTYFKIGKYENALSDLNRAITLNPTDQYNFYYRAEIKMELQDFDGSIEDFKTSLRLYPTGADQLYPRLALAHIFRSLQHSQNFQFGAALDDAERAIRIQPNNYLGYYARGEAYRKDDDRYIYPKSVTEQAKLAVNDYSHCIRLQPSFPDAYAKRAIIFHKYGKLQRAFEDIKKALLIQPTNVDFIMCIQMVVNTIANDGNDIVLLSPIVIGINNYGMVRDWDDYLSFRLKRKN